MAISNLPVEASHETYAEHFSEDLSTPREILGSWVISRWGTSLGRSQTRRQLSSVSSTAFSSSPGGWS